MAQWPSYLAYLVGFSTIGAARLGHTAITHYLDRVDALLVRFNLILLMFVSFIPFPTRLVAEHVDDLDAERIAATLLGVNLFLVSVSISSMWRHAVRRKLVRPDADDDEVRALTTRLTPGLAAYVALILVAWFFPLAAVFGYLGIALLLIIPFGHREGTPEVGDRGAVSGRVSNNRKWWSGDRVRWRTGLAVLEQGAERSVGCESGRVRTPRCRLRGRSATGSRRRASRHDARRALRRPVPVFLSPSPQSGQPAVDPEWVDRLTPLRPRRRGLKIRRS
ncbi:MAG: TMEM175 family protein [Acidimicrobiia bacterium]